MKLKTALFSELRGSLTQAFLGEKPTCRTRADGTIILQKRPVPRYVRTAAQDTQRSKFSACKEDWNNLSDQAKQEYTDQAEELRLTGYNLFLKLCMTQQPLTLYERYVPASPVYANFHGDRWYAQTFTIGNTGANEEHTIELLKVKLYRVGLPGTLNVYIKAVDGENKPTGENLATGSINGNVVTTSVGGAVYSIYITAFDLQPSTKYAWILSLPDGDGSNLLYFFYKWPSPAYTGGTVVRSLDGGSTWTLLSTWDGYFKEYGRKV